MSTKRLAPSTGLPANRSTRSSALARESRRAGFELLIGLVAVMWILEIVNTLDSNGLDSDGIWPRNIGRLWGILTAPLLHASFAHLIGNTIPLVFMGAIVALRGAGRLAWVTLTVIVLGGLGTWLIGPSSPDTIGASGVVFGYATYLLARGFFNRSVLELMTGLIVGAVWGAALVSSLVPHPGISWQGHLCGGIAGVIAAYALSRRREEPLTVPGLTAR